MVRKCCVTGCQSNYRNSLKKDGYVKVFKFPSDEALLQQWLSKIPRQNRSITENTAICYKHFEERMVIKFDSYIDSEGQLKVVARKSWKLAPDACPTIFPKAVSSLSDKSRGRTIKYRKQKCMDEGPGDDEMSASEHDSPLAAEHVIKNGKKATPRRKRVISSKNRRTDDTSNSLDDVDIKPELDLDGNIIPLLEATGRLLEETGDITAASHESNQSPDFRQTLLQFQKDGYLCDTLLIGQGCQIRVHGVVMAAASTYFKSFLTSSDMPLLNETPTVQLERTIDVADVDLPVLEIAIHLAYTGELPIAQLLCVAPDRLSAIFTTLLKLGFACPNPMSCCDISSRDVNRASYDDASSFAADIGSAGLSTSALRASSAAATNRARGRLRDNDWKSRRQINKVIGLKSKRPRLVVPVQVGDNTEPVYCYHRGPAPPDGLAPAVIELKSRADSTATADSTVSRSAGNNDSDGNASDATEINDDIITCVKTTTTTTTEKKRGRKSNSGASGPTVGSFLCGECGKVFETRAKLEYHGRVHFGERNPYVCGDCGRQFSLPEVLRRHRKLHTGDRPHLCQECGRGFIRLSRLREHLLQHHSEAAKKMAGVKVFSCDRCPETFPTYRRLWAHRRTNCGQQPMQLTEAERKRSAGKVRAPKKPMPPVCRTFLCQTCKRQCSSNLSYAVHVQQHTGRKTMACAVCSQEFECKRSLIEHFIVHADQLPFACKICGIAFTYQSLLMEHEKLHAGVLPHICATCGKGFPRPSALASHELVHSGVKPFQCTACGKRCRELAHLKRHMLTHTGERPHACDHCNKRYRTRFDLRIHCRTIHKMELPATHLIRKFVLRPPPPPPAVVDSLNLPPSKENV